MAISYPRAFPTYTGLTGFRISRLVSQALNVSPTSLDPQVEDYSGARWELQVSLPAMKRAEAAPWQAWLSSLNGMEGSFNASDPLAASPRGTASGSWTANGTVRARTVQLTGTGNLKAGDYVTIGGRYLHQVLVDGNSGATFDIWPPLRASGSSMTTAVTSPYGRWMLVEMDQWESVVGDYYLPVTFRAIEDRRP